MDHGCELLILTSGPSPHLRGYVSRAITTRLILATQPWSHVAMTAVVISAMPAHFNSTGRHEILIFTKHVITVGYIMMEEHFRRTTSVKETEKSNKSQLTFAEAVGFVFNLLNLWPEG